ncbi:hypothetical protein M3204_04985 [Mesobacillus subterraneus]|jgi:hypothetical protein|nr:hypothetical protein [Mesobacillus subterraneus]
MKIYDSPLDFQNITNYNYVHNKSIKCNDEDMGFLERFAEREGKAENFLTQKETLTTSELQS